MVAKAKKHKSGGRRNHVSHDRATKVHAQKLQPARGAAMKPSEPAKGATGKADKAENGFQKPGDLNLPVIIPKPDEPVVHVERERSSYDGDTAIKLYLREIGQVKLLTPQEEIELAARIKKGDKKAREQMI
jgi:DNA-directed RNA polymerase sigma subunit (sigma70/sigma32)